MKYLILGQPRVNNSFPTENLVSMMQATYDWSEELKKSGVAESIYALHNHGGMLIINVDGHEDVHDLLFKHPLYSFMDWRIEPLLDVKKTHKFNTRQLKALGLS